MTDKRRAVMRYNDKKNKMCIIEETKKCDDCCACFVCEIDSSKICDNCAKCVEINVPGNVYSGVLGSKYLKDLDKEFKKIIEEN